MHKKIESNHELRYNMEYNKIIANTMLAAKRDRDVQTVKSIKNVSDD